MSTFAFDIALSILFGSTIAWSLWMTVDFVFAYLVHCRRMRELKRMEHLTNKARWEARQGNFQEAKRLSDEFWERMQRFEKEKRQ